MDGIDFSGQPPLSTKTSLTYGEESTPSYAISRNTVERFIASLVNETRQVGDILPIMKGADTLLYIVNFRNNAGWYIVSGDKRTEYILAQKGSGHLDLTEDNPGVDIWINDLTERIYDLRQNGEADSTSANYKMWSALESMARLENLSSSASTFGLTDDPIVERHSTRTEGVVSMQTHRVVTANVEHLTRTKWGQYYPLNFKVGGINGMPYLTGCVAVAGAQMLYFLHDKLGKPETAYTNAVQIDNGNGTYSFNYSNPTTTAWQEMYTNCEYDYNELTSYGYNLVSILMGEVGKSVGMRYGVDKSVADDSKLRGLFNQKGIQCTYTQKFVAETAIANLERGMPIMLSATGRSVANSAIAPLSSAGGTSAHAWIMDGYQKSYDQTDYVYEELIENYIRYASGKVNIRVIHTGKLRYDTTYSNQSTFARMNWGYSGEWDDGEYLMDGEWISNSTSYSYDKNMYYDFRLL